MRRATAISLAPGELRTLQGWASVGDDGGRRALRSRIVLEAARGRTNAEIAAELATNPETVARWRARFAINGLEGVEREAPRLGDPRRVPSETVGRVLHASLKVELDPGARRSTRALARSLQVNHMLVHRIWRAHGLAEPGGPAGLGEHRELPTVEVAGAILTDGLRAIVFVVGPRGGATGPEGPGEEPPAHVRLPALVADLEALAAGVVRSVRRLERVRRSRLGIRRSPAPLLVFLRAVERHADASARLDLLVDCEADRLPVRVAEWLAAHPRFRLYPRRRGQRWSESVDGWLHRWLTAGIDGESLRATDELGRAFPRDGGRGQGARLSWVRPSVRRAGNSARPAASPDVQRERP